MDVKKQQLIINYLLSSPDLFALCHTILKPDYFDPGMRPSINFILNYYDSYNALPDAVQVYAETNWEFAPDDLTDAQFKYCQTEIEQFCKRRALEIAIHKAPKLLSEGDYNGVETSVKEALLISLQKNLGLDYFEDPLVRLEQMKIVDSLTSTGWEMVDYWLGGGIRRKEMILFSANSGGGKSITMANLGLNLLRQGLDILYISFELSEELIAKRYDSMVGNVKSVQILNQMENVAKTILQCKETHGRLRIKRMPVGKCANDVRAYLKEYELRIGKLPDALIVDYLDLMGPNEKNQAVGGVFEKDKAVAEQLREIGEDYNMFIITASQQNRQAVEATTLNHSHIAGGISKINTTDVYISIIMSAQMKSQGVMMFEFLKTRSSDGVGEKVQLKWVNDYLRVENDPEANFDKPTPELLLKKTKTVGGTTVTDRFSTEGEPTFSLINSFNDDD